MKSQARAWEKDAHLIKNLYPDYKKNSKKIRTGQTGSILKGGRYPVHLLLAVYSKGEKNHIPRDLALNVHSICNNKKRKRHKCFSTGDRLNRLCYSHNEILLSNEQEETVALPNKPDEPQNNNADKSQVKECIIYDCIYIYSSGKCKLIYSDRGRAVVVLGQGRR